MLRVGVELVALVAVLGLLRDRVVVGLVRGDEPAGWPQWRVLEQPVVVAGVVACGKAASISVVVVMMCSSSSRVTTSFTTKFTRTL